MEEHVPEKQVDTEAEEEQCPRDARNADGATLKAEEEGNAKRLDEATFKNRSFIL